MNAGFLAELQKKTKPASDETASGNKSNPPNASLMAALKIRQQSQGGGGPSGKPGTESLMAALKSRKPPPPPAAAAAAAAA
eukprot:CAMPEP_0172396562 /NCGR_PEP_ID=MMETSP1061-20121228/25815_1 /TAXON_ID=37318 /ORGANISM="Pseudo-nitzschia pungens, Strain cf. pungens" /LENGTH=80 /DNA_ID=CAMNT_0013128445 /DNA_START=40 /DNA_END=278 /DNA_ORIENTATION=-